MRRLSLVLLLVVAGCLDNAREYDGRAVTLNNQAYKMLRQGNLDQALLLVNDAIKVDAEFDAAYINKAAILDKMGKRDDAVQTLQRLLELSPRNSDACIAAGVLLEKSGKKAEAETHYARALKLYSASAETAPAEELDAIQTNMAIAEYLLGDSRAALETLQAVLAKTPEFDRAIEVKQRIESGRREYFLGGP